MRRLVGSMLVLLLALPALRADDKPKDDQKQPPAKQQYDALAKEFASQQRQILSEAQKLKGAEQQKHYQKYFALGSEFADRFYKIAEDHPDDPVATDALFWVAQNGGNSPATAKAVKKLTPVLEKMPLKDLAGRLRMIRVSDAKVIEVVFKRADENSKDPDSADLLFWIVQNDRISPTRAKAVKKISVLIDEMPLGDLAARLKNTFNLGPDIMAAVFKRAEKEIKSEESSDLLAWVVQNGSYLPIGKKALSQLAEHYRDNPAVELAIQAVINSASADTVGPMRTILEKTQKPRVKALVTLALGQSLAAKVDTLGDNIPEANKTAEETERYLTKFVDEYSKDFPNFKSVASGQIKALHFNRVGLTTPEIAAQDLDSKEFKLSDYRGKVVLLDFWGNW